jgi:hypothetical protein
MTDGLPMDLQEWAMAHKPDEDLLYKSGYWRQIIWVRDDLCGLVSRGMKGPRIKARVISTHGSKSVGLPVYELERPDLGIRLILRDNFYNWKLTVMSALPIVADFSGLFHTTPPVEPKYTGNPLSSCYFEGFPEELVFGYYEPSDKRHWSAEINGGDQVLWAVVFLIMKSLGAAKPFRWHTRESHALELAEQSARWRAEREAQP